MRALFNLQTRSAIRRRLERAFRLQIISASMHGHRDCTDIEKSGYRISVVFDVGANVGQSADKFNDAFPSAQIHCFEPVIGTFRTLSQHVSGRSNILCHRIALGDRDGEATLYLTGSSDDNSTTNSLIRSSKTVGTEIVTLQTLDHFCLSAGVQRIDLLKIDAEGADLDVLRGAEGMLSASRVAFVLAEVGFHPGDDRHVLFDDVRSLLVPFGFSVFGIYDQQLEWTGEQKLRFANVCFANEGACAK